MSSTLLVVLVLLSIWRLARLVTIDYLSEPLREWAGRRGPKIEYLFTCPWCMSVWVSPLLAVPAVLWPTNRVVWVVVICLAGSGVAGFLATVEDRLDR